MCSNGKISSQSKKRVATRKIRQTCHKHHTFTTFALKTIHTWPSTLTSSFNRGYNVFPIFL